MFLLIGLLLLGFSSAYDRLSRDSYPLRYSLLLSPVMSGDFSYTGELSIVMKMNETNTFSLDCDGLNVTNTSMSFDNSWSVKHVHQQVGSRLIVTTERIMKAAYEIEFNISFRGLIRKELSGFYLSKYMSSGAQRFLGSTHFETAGARKAFPCFDEPAFRANFSLELHLEPGWAAFSNTPLLQDQTIANVRSLRFAEQESIPVYLVAWVIYEDGPFGGRSVQMSTSCGSFNSTKYTVWSNSDYKDEYDISLLAAPVLVKGLENFTGITCKAVKEKMDLVAIPDFSAGAMENWGLITFRENVLLFDKMYSTASDMQQIIMVVAHELAHQWFGNLVTPDWWSFVWLSEGFARYLQYFIPHKDFPDLRLDEQFVVERRQLALEKDSVQSHPLTNENINTIPEIEDNFDIITYDKGASVIHMIRSLLGAEFDTGINVYLNTVDNSGGVTNPDRFFASFPSLPPLMKLWTETSGYPVIVASEMNSTLSLRQIKITGWNQVNESHWLVPISINIDGNVTWHHLQPNETLIIPLHVNSTYFINVNQTGYYRVMYLNQSRWEPAGVSSLTRSMLIDDVMSLAYSGLISYHEAIPITAQHLTSDVDYLPWRTGLRTLDRLRMMLDGNPLERNFTEHVLSWMNGVIDYIAFNSTQNLSLPLKLHQMNILRHACSFGHEKCLKAADQLASNISDSVPEQRSALLCTVVKRGNITTWESILNQYKAARSPAESQLLLNSLTCTTDRALLQRLLNLLMTDTVRKHNVKTIISLISSTRVGVEEAFSFFKNNWSRIYNYTGDLSVFKNILSSVTAFVNNTNLLELKQIAQTAPYLQMDSFIKSLESSLPWKNNVVRQVTTFLNGEPVPTDCTVTDKPQVTTTHPSVEPTSGSNRNQPQYLYTFTIFLGFYVFINNYFKGHVDLLW